MSETGTAHSNATIAIWRIENSLIQKGSYFGISAMNTGWRFAFLNYDHLVDTSEDWVVALEKVDKSTPFGTYTEAEIAANDVAFSLINESVKACTFTRIKKDGPKWTIHAMGKDHTVTAASMAQALCCVSRILSNGKQIASMQEGAQEQNKITSDDVIERVFDHLGRLAIEKKKDGTWSISLGDYGLLCNLSLMLAQQ